MNNFVNKNKEGILFVCFSLFLVGVFVFLSLFDYGRFFFSDVMNLPIFKNGVVYEERNFSESASIIVPKHVKGGKLSAFEDVNNLHGKFQLSDETPLSEGKSIKLLDYDSKGAYATLELKNPIEYFEALRFDVYSLDFTDLLRFNIRLKDVNGKFFEATVDKKKNSNQWNQVVLSAEDFADWSGPPIGISSITFEVNSFAASDLEIYIDNLFYEDNREFISSWSSKNLKALSIENVDGKNYFAYKNKPGDSMAFFEEISGFRDGSIMAEISSSSVDAACGLVLRGRDISSGVYVFTTGLKALGWNVWDASSSGSYLLNNGIVPGLSVDLGDSIFLKLVLDKNAGAVYAGEAPDDLELRSIFYVPSLEEGKVGIVSLNQSRCRFKDVLVNYDPL